MAQASYLPDSNHSERSPIYNPMEPHLFKEVLALDHFPRTMKEKPWDPGIPKACKVFLSSDQFMGKGENKAAIQGKRESDAGPYCLNYLTQAPDNLLRKLGCIQVRIHLFELNIDP